MVNSRYGMGKQDDEYYRRANSLLMIYRAKDYNANLLKGKYKMYLWCHGRLDFVHKIGGRLSVVSKVLKNKCRRERITDHMNERDSVDAVIAEVNPLHDGDILFPDCVCASYELINQLVRMELSLRLGNLIKIKPISSVKKLDIKKINAVTNSKESDVSHIRDLTEYARLECMDLCRYSYGNMDKASLKTLMKEALQRLGTPLRVDYQTWNGKYVLNNDDGTHRFALARLYCLDNNIDCNPAVNLFVRTINREKLETVLQSYRIYAFKTTSEHIIHDMFNRRLCNGANLYHHSINGNILVIDVRDDYLLDSLNKSIGKFVLLNAILANTYMICPAKVSL